MGTSLTLANLAMACGALDDVVSARIFMHRALAACNATGCVKNRRHVLVLLRAAITHQSLGDVLDADKFASSALQVLVELVGSASGSRTMQREKIRSARIWSVAGRQDVLKWLDTTITVERLSRKIRGSVCSSVIGQRASSSPFSCLTLRAVVRLVNRN